MSVWVEILNRERSDHLAWSRSTWACELKFMGRITWQTVYRSRSTWACELKFAGSFFSYRNEDVTLHVSVWVEMHTDRRPPHGARVTLHVSVWVEICLKTSPTNRVSGHAPRERVSWNRKNTVIYYLIEVTLHVSVWVEMINAMHSCLMLLSRSTWACELKYLSVRIYNHFNLSRSTWACELKCHPIKCTMNECCHAPRERVSWNIYASRNASLKYRHAPRERVSWNYVIFL